MRDIRLYRHFLDLEPPSKARTVEVNAEEQPRARFTLLFERLAIDVLREADVDGAARILHVSWDEAWHILERAVARGQQARGPRVVAQVGIDEKAIARGQQYVTVVCDLDRATVEYVADERKRASLEGYFAGLAPERLAGIEALALDMWEPYLQAIRAYVPGAEAKIVFDRFHIVRHMGRAVDTVRKREHRALRKMGDDTLTGSRYLCALRRGEPPGQASRGSRGPCECPGRAPGVLHESARRIATCRP